MNYPYLGIKWLCFYNWNFDFRDISWWAKLQVKEKFIKLLKEKYPNRIISILFAYMYICICLYMYAWLNEGVHYIILIQFWPCWLIKMYLSFSLINIVKDFKKKELWLIDSWYLLCFSILYSCKIPEFVELKCIITIAKLWRYTVQGYFTIFKKDLFHWTHKQPAFFPLLINSALA